MALIKKGQLHPSLTTSNDGMSSLRKRFNELDMEQPAPDKNIKNISLFTIGDDKEASGGGGMITEGGPMVTQGQAPGRGGRGFGGSLFGRNNFRNREESQAQMDEDIDSLLNN